MFCPVLVFLTRYWYNNSTTGVSPTGGIIINTVSTAKTIWDGLDWSVLYNILIAVIPALLCITIHELCHGFVAYKLGDNTAKDLGRLTLNPIKHIDIFGLVMLAIFKFGWAKPVPINMNNFKNPKAGMAITALAGPVSNLLLAAVTLLIYGFLYSALGAAGKVGGFLLDTLFYIAYISCALAVLNIIPIPPLDGSKVLFSFLPNHIYNNLMKYEFFGMILLIALIWSEKFSPFLSNMTAGLYNFLFNIAQWAHNLTLVIS